mgnify:CR=1 FL=1|jgi:tRNA (guanine-N7-)-methyltransferase
MRLRKKKDAKAILQEQTDLVVLDPAKLKGNWQSFFGGRRPIHAELGMGKGLFISKMSVRHPDVNFVGVDRYDELIRRASVKADALWKEAHGRRPDNLALVLFNVERLTEMFADGEVDRIYLNFSDPWPKKRHVKRRLTHPRFLGMYARVLKPGGEIHFKTDSAELFEYSLNTFSDFGFRLRNITFDLHAGGVSPDAVLTEYEQKFVEQGKPIYRCEALLDGRTPDLRIETPANSANLL